MWLVYECPRDYLVFWHIGARMGVGPVRRFLARMRRRGKASLIDIGSGAGSNALIAARSGFRVAACDLAPRNLAELRRVAGELDVRSAIAPVRADALALPVAPESFDVAIASHIIEHLPDPGRLLAGIARVLKPGGVLRLSCPSRCHGMRIARWFGADLDPADHVVLGYSRDELARMLPEGFRITRVTYQGRFLESNLADLQHLVSRALGVRATVSADAAPGDAPATPPGRLFYLLKECVLLPALALCALEDALLWFVPGSMITLEIERV
ncbi:MAG: class I SAM-dependent methyltransferase [Candidatus Hydrogenedentes bacterium]|nr:class I SAM-dependent methyltransferase [Candidatus Hydrogenedentota bacterium]